MTTVERTLMDELGMLWTKYLDELLPQIIYTPLHTCLEQKFTVTSTADRPGYAGWVSVNMMAKPTSDKPGYIAASLVANRLDIERPVWLSYHEACTWLIQQLAARGHLFSIDHAAPAAIGVIIQYTVTP